MTVIARDVMTAWVVSRPMGLIISPSPILFLSLPLLKCRVACNLGISDMVVDKLLLFKHQPAIGTLI